MEEILKINNVSKSFGKVKAFNNTKNNKINNNLEGENYE